MKTENALGFNLLKNAYDVGHISVILVLYDGNMMMMMMMMMVVVVVVVVVYMLFYLTSVGHTVAQSAEALRYKTEGRRFDSRWCHSPSGHNMAVR